MRSHEALNFPFELLSVLPLMVSRMTFLTNPRLKYRLVVNKAFSDKVCFISDKVAPPLMLTFGEKKSK